MGHIPRVALNRLAWQIIVQGEPWHLAFDAPAHLRPDDVGTVETADRNRDTRARHTGSDGRVVARRG